MMEFSIIFALVSALYLAYTIGYSMGFKRSTNKIVNLRKEFEQLKKDIAAIK